MAWEVVPKKNNVETFISINRNHVVFNTGTVRTYDLKKYKSVILLVDDDKKKIGFKFSANPKEDLNSFSLTSCNNYLTLYTKKLTLGRDWLQKLLLLPASDRRFTPSYDTEEELLTITI